MGGWENFWSTTIATAVGGVIAALAGYWFAKRSSTVSATYDVVRNIVSDEFTEKRQMIADLIRSDYEIRNLCHVLPDDERLYKVRTNALYILNYYDIIMSCIKDGAMDGRVIKDTVWEEIIKADHVKLDSFIEEYAKKHQKPRPLFPSLREYRKIWG